MSHALTWRAALNQSILELIARVIRWCEPPQGAKGDGPRHPLAETVRVLATLQRFLREGTQGRFIYVVSEPIPPRSQAFILSSEIEDDQLLPPASEETREMAHAGTNHRHGRRL